MVLEHVTQNPGFVIITSAVTNIHTLCYRDLDIVHIPAIPYRFKDRVGKAKEKDILWAFSTSGNSPNILAAADIAKMKKARVIAFTGMEDSPLEKQADLCLCVRSFVVSSSQEMHQLAYHIICDLVEDQIMNSK